MKKLLMFALVVAMLLVSAIPCFAEASDVKVNYTPGSGAEAVYSVNVTFGAMTFTYTDAAAGSWNPETHEYVGATEAAWSCAEGANVVTVTNHSNAAVAVTVTYAAAEGFDAITGTVANGSFTLPTAEGKAVGAAELTATASLTLAGALASTTAANTVAGTVTVAFVGA